jgi:hypothetical protein
VHNAFGNSGCSAGGNDNGVSSFDGDTVNFLVAFAIEDDGGFNGAENPLAFGFWETLVEGEDGVAVLPRLLNTLNHGLATWHIETDQFVHVFSVWGVRHLTNDKFTDSSNIGLEEMARGI